MAYFRIVDQGAGAAERQGLGGGGIDTHVFLRCCFWLDQRLTNLHHLLISQGADRTRQSVETVKPGLHYRKFLARLV